jgi:acyl-[acyl carrier protein]--UDP-N-acetylglucosamine O-acyltransferase
MKKYFYSIKELRKLGVKKIGKNCQISKRISIYSSQIVLGDNVRIDDDVCLKGVVEIKNYVHIARGCTLSGGESGIYIDEFTSISNYTQFFCTSDIYNSNHVPTAAININQIKKSDICSIISGKIKIGKCCIVGPFNIVLPNTVLGSYSTTEPYSVLLKKIKSGTISKKNGIKKKRNVTEIVKRLTLLKKIL